jgi:hypothetical protein
MKYLGLHIDDHIKRNIHIEKLTIKIGVIFYIYIKLLKMFWI